MSNAQFRLASKFEFPLSLWRLVDSSGAKREGFDSIKAARDVLQQHAAAPDHRNR
jgi:hypothetical protein